MVISEVSKSFKAHLKQEQKLGLSHIVILDQGNPLRSFTQNRHTEGTHLVKILDLFPSFIKNASINKIAHYMYVVSVNYFDIKADGKHMLSNFVSLM